MRPAGDAPWLVLVPFDAREGLSLNAAAKRAGKSETTVRNWCAQHGLGRRVGGGVWVVSKVALAMFLDGDKRALRCYHTGDRTSELVVPYFHRAGLTK
jgi:Helix-turn-helix domain